MEGLWTYPTWRFSNYWDLVIEMWGKNVILPNVDYRCKEINAKVLM